jgi:phenylacetate-coenzyme A ligase PaaK-like adenylate-forming protein
LTPFGNITLSCKYLPGEYHTLISFPHLFPIQYLDTFKKIVSYGEPWTGVGIDLYSSEEFGIISIQCPNNKEVLHIMDNLEIVFTPEGMRITDLSHPYLKDYEIGDYAEPRICNCSIKLPAMSHVKGRIRNMIKMPDGTVKWPMFGLLTFPEIKRFQVFQESLYKLRVHIDGIITDEALASMRKWLNYDFEIEIVQGNFKEGKHEEFICEI